MSDILWPHALVEGMTRKPEPGLRGSCLECANPMIAKCGTELQWHWAHLVPNTDCSAWSAEETAWHAEWKDRFPAEFREIQVGRNRADVRFEDGRTIEVQHSRIRSDQVVQREKAYGPGLVWIFNSTPAASHRPRFTFGRSVATFSYPHPHVALAACERQVYLDLGARRLLKVRRQYDEGHTHCGWGTITTHDEFVNNYTRRA